MAELEIRPARQEDLDKMVALDHNSTSEYAYKLEVTHDKGSFTQNFQRVYLPRAVTLNYPKDEATLFQSWDKADALFVGILLSQVIAYVALDLGSIKDTVRVSDLVVAPPIRRKGVGSGILLACEGWAHDHKAHRLLMELQMRNDPAIQMVKKLGYQMCGYMDQYFPNRDTALFFDKRIS
ncbi:MAG: GNAT family N-acetyltransferase [Anaerolineaceae bacterium]